jgi:hypothetical protein
MGNFSAMEKGYQSQVAGGNLTPTPFRKVYESLFSNAVKINKRQLCSVKCILPITGLIGGVRKIADMVWKLKAAL